MEFCGMKREIDRKCLNHARVHANAQSFDRCGGLLQFFRDLLARAAIACATSVFVARAKMTQLTSRSNENQFST